MRAPLIATLTATLVLSACSTVRESRINPFNWFGQSQETRVVTLDADELPGDPRPLIGEVTALAMEAIPGGAILRANGLPPRQGYWDAELVEVPSDDGATRVFDFRAAAPLEATLIGPVQSREITVGLYLSDQDLAPIRRIIVRGASNQRSTRR